MIPGTFSADVFLALGLNVSRENCSRLPFGVDVADAMSSLSCSIRASILPRSGITYSVRIRESVPSL